jgi:hypothetical protein
MANSHQLLSHLGDIHYVLYAAVRHCCKSYRCQPIPMLNCSDCILGLRLARNFPYSSVSLRLP